MNGMDTTCCYDVEDKNWLHDPEGNAWEICYIKEDSKFESAGEPVVGGVCCISEPVEIQFGNLSNFKK